MDRLSNRIREFRFRTGEMTQKELAERVGVSRQTMNAIENGRHAPSVAVAIRIADVFAVTVDQLFDLNYGGKRSRHEPPARVAVDRSTATIKEPVEVEGSPEPLVEKADRQVSLADLRGVIGP